MDQTIAVLKRGEGRTLKAGGLWVYDNEIISITGHIDNGMIVSVRDFDGYPMGKGFINMNSRIRIRMLTRDEHQEIDDDFLRRRLQTAWDYRKLVCDTSSCRIVFGEADFLPGLVIDKYEDVLVFQISALGMDRLKNRIIPLIVDILGNDNISVRGIYERSDGKYRKQEGIDISKGFLSEPFDTDVHIVENGVKYIVDIKDGQKTGFFLDQKYNRLAIQNLSNGMDVLDCFTHTGSFALNAALGGAKSVIGVDASGLAVKQAEENARLNGLQERVSFIEADVLDLLPRYEREGRAFDMVILDPPAFTKSKNSVKAAMKGYRDINMRGMKLVRKGGVFATCSCSHFMTPELFTQMIMQAAKSAHKTLRVIEQRAQGPDHPVIWPLDDSSYLKFYIFQVM